MSLWICTKCKAITGGSVGSPQCAVCGSFEVERADFDINKRVDLAITYGTTETQYTVNSDGDETWTWDSPESEKQEEG